MDPKLRHGTMHCEHRLRRAALCGAGGAQPHHRAVRTRAAAAHGVQLPRAAPQPVPTTRSTRIAAASCNCGEMRWNIFSEGVFFLRKVLAYFVQVVAVADNAWHQKSRCCAVRCGSHAHSCLRSTMSVVRIAARSLGSLFPASSALTAAFAKTRDSSAPRSPGRMAVASLIAGASMHDFIVFWQTLMQAWASRVHSRLCARQNKKQRPKQASRLRAHRLFDTFWAHI